MTRLLFITLWRPNLQLFHSIPLDGPYSLYPTHSNSMVYFINMYLTRSLSVSQTEKWRLNVSVIRENCSRLTQRALVTSILSWRKFCTYLLPFEIIILKKGKDLTFIEHLFSKCYNKNFPYIILFVFSQKLCEGVWLYGFLENPRNLIY